MPERLQEAYIKGSIPWIRAEARKQLQGRGLDVWVTDMMPDALIVEDGPGTQVWRYPFQIVNGELQLGEAEPYELVLQPATRIQAIVQEAMDALGRWARLLTTGEEQVPLVEAMGARLIEAAQPAAGRRFVKPDGTVDLVLIKAGRGNPADNHFYPAQTLARDHGVFVGGKMFFDHPDAIEEATRPERRVKDMAARIQSTWWNPQTEEIMATVKPITTEVADFLEEAGDMVEVSINAMGVGKFGTAPDGQPAKVVERIVAGSADFVTQAGAGGRLVPLFEAFKSKRESEPSMFDPSKLTPAQFAQLREARPELFAGIPATGQTPDLAALQSEVKALREANTNLSTQVVTLQGENLVGKCAAVIAEAIDGENLPDYTAGRVRESFKGKVFAKDGQVDVDGIKAAVKAAADAERAYLTKVAEAAGAGRISGFGPSTQQPAETDPQKLKEAAFAQRVRVFQGMGYSEEQAKRLAQ